MRVVTARAISIVGHPMVLVPAAALIAASTQGAGLMQLQRIGAAMALLAAVVLGFSWLQVRSGRWSHVDASVHSERRSLNVFLALLLLVSAVIAWRLTRHLHMTIALSLSALLIFIALLSARWMKLSLHVSFAAFATALCWPNSVAVVVGIAITAAVTWSRPVLGRHVTTDVVAGLLIGAAAGVAYHVAVAQLAPLP